MLATLLTALLTAAPAMAAMHIKTQGNTFDLCIDNKDGKLQAGNPLQVYVSRSCEFKLTLQLEVLHGRK